MSRAALPGPSATAPIMARLPLPEWAHRAAAGAHTGLDWVDATLEVHRDIFGMVADGSGEVRFQHLPYVGFLPPAMMDAAAAAQERGVATLQEALILLFARAEWLVASQSRLLSPTTPVPAVLALLVEAYGIGPGLHRDDPEVLARLAALLPVWYPTRGSLGAATRLLAATQDPDVEAPEPQGVQTPEPRATDPRATDPRATDPRATDPRATDRRATDPRATDPRATETVTDQTPLGAAELFACHTLSWWEARAEGPLAPLEIRAEVAVIPADAPVPLRREDLAWTCGSESAPPLDGAASAPTLLLRLLPPWTVVRPFLALESA